MNELDGLTTLYDRYVDTYRGTDGRLPEMMQLKRTHTEMVVRNAELIAAGERFAADVRGAALAAALLHDTGRYEQLRRFNTFKDSDSVDHAVFSHDIVKTSGWLDDRPDREAILAAILYHNRREVPTGMDALTDAAVHTVRDADKLDIFRVLESLVTKGDWRLDTRAFWNLAIHAAPNPVVIDCIRRRASVDYQNIRSLADFVLIQVGWMICSLHFATARRLCAERGHLAFRRDFLHEIVPDADLDDLFNLAEEALK